MFGSIFLALLLSNALTAMPQAPASAFTPTASTADFRAKDELLLNAVHRGNRKLWSDSTTPDFLYIEDGEINKREAFLKDLEEDGSAPLVIETYDLHQIGDTVMVLHLDTVRARPTRDTSNVHLLFSETWQRIDGQWKLRLIDVNRLRVDPPAIELTPTQAAELTGTYRNGTRVYTIRREGQRLFATRTGGTETEWKAEAPDVLFLPGENRSRKVFFSDSTGEIIKFADRDESSEVVWLKQ